MSKTKIENRKPLVKEEYPTLYAILTHNVADLYLLSHTERELFTCGLTKELEDIASDNYETYLLVLLVLGSHFKCRRIASILRQRIDSSCTEGCDLASTRCTDCSLRWLF